VTKVNFYSGVDDKLRLACTLSHKAMQNGVRVLLSAPDEHTHNALNKLLWHYPDTAFIPHCNSDAPEADDMPVVLDQGSGVSPHHELLISLHEECPSFFSRFERVIEIIGRDEDDKLKGRARFKFYKDRGYELEHFDLSGKKGA